MATRARRDRGRRVAEPYRLTLTGRHEQAAGWWQRAGAVFDEAMANADSAVTERRIEAIERLDLLGATATADRLRHLLRREASRSYPLGPGPAPATIRLD